MTVVQKAGTARKGWTVCRECGQKVKEANLERHFSEMHPKAKVDTSEKRRLTDDPDKTVMQELRESRYLPVVAVVSIIIVMVAAMGAWAIMNPPEPSREPVSGGLTPLFSTTIVSGGTFDLENELESKPVLLHFCHAYGDACVALEPTLVDAHSYADGSVTFVSGVSGNLSSEVQQWQTDMGATWPHFVASDKVTDLFKIQRLPTFFIIDTDEEIILRNEGGIEESELNYWLNMVVNN